MSLQGYRELVCECGGKDFVPVVRVIWQQAAGSVSKPNGLFCMGCNKPVDQARMIVKAKKEDAQQQIRDLESSLG